MKPNCLFSRMLGILAGAAMLLVTGLASATQPATDPIDMLYNFQATGTFQSYDPSTGKSTYLISAVGRAPTVRGNGIVHPRTQYDDDEDYTVQLSNAMITFDPFDPSNPPPIVNFTCQGCTLTFPDGSTLVSDPNVPLHGEGLFLYGPVNPQPDSSILTIRMMGCSGLKEVAGVGKLANMSNPNQLPATITGSSNCTIVTHTPVSQ
jgi:hypothetical protein